MAKVNYRLFLAVAVVVASAFGLRGAEPSGYYNSLNGKSEGELKTAVYNLVHSFTQVSSYNALPSYFQKTDVYPQSKRWWDMYSDIPLYAPNFAGLNREHSFPKSWWGGSTSVSAYVDLNHLYPSESEANMAKSNYPLGVVNTSTNVTFNNGVCMVGAPINGQGGGASLVFEPADEYKGDFARTYFYMVTCYQNLTWRYTYMAAQGTYPTLQPWAINLLLAWHRADPVSQKEIDRNEQVYKIQNNRNPFIDRPELAEYIWGVKKGEKYTPGSVVVPPSGSAELLAPLDNMDLDFGEIAVGHTVNRKLLVKGANIANGIETQIWSGNSGMFNCNVRIIPAAQVCTDDGYWLSVSYKPTATGAHTSKLLLSGAFGSRSVILRGEAQAVPTLSAPVAEEPTAIAGDRYTANWTVPAGEVIDYYIVTRTIYSGNSVRTEELDAETNSLEITGFEDSDRESYCVQSSRLGVRSPKSNIVFVAHSGIDALEVDEPLLVQCFDGFIRFICSTPQTGCRIYDMAGRQVRTIDMVEQDMDVDMPRGVYLIVTDQHHSPVKVLTR